MHRHSGDDKTGPASQRAMQSRAASPFVGRDVELCRLTAALDLAAEGRSKTVFLIGEQGIGKTRLAREALDLARRRDFTALEGRAYPLGVGLAYAPFLDAFRPLLRRIKPARLDALIGDLPSLGHVFEGLHRSGAVLPLEGLGDPVLDKIRLFEAISRLVERLAQEAPVSLFLDDLQWAEPATLELLHYLARGLFDQQALIFAAFSEGILGATPSLQTLAASLEREGLADRIVVPRLGPDAVAELARGILGEEASADLLALLEARAGGTPLFVEALIAFLIDSGNLVRASSGWVLNAEGPLALPPSIRRLILDQLERLGATDRRVLDVLAVMGDTTSHAVLRAASGLDDEALIGTLWRLRDTGLVSEKTDGLEVVYNVTHPLVQEVAYAELPKAARQRSHAAAIAALESFPQGRPDDLNRLVRHYRGAGSEANRAHTLRVLLAAGQRALSVYANEEAARYFDIALTMVREDSQAAGSTECDKSLMPLLLERLGEVWERIGKLEAAEELWNEALERQEQNDDIVAVSRLRRQLALAEWTRGHFDTANEHLEAGLVGLASHGACQELADLHYTRYHVLSLIGDVAGVAQTADILLSLADQLGSPRAEAEANLAASTSFLWQRDITNARKRALHALAVGEQARDLAICCRAHIEVVSIGMRLGDHRLMRYHAERGLAVAQRLGGPNLEVQFRLRLAYANFVSGAWNDSLLCTIEAIALARRVDHPRDLAYSLAWRAMILALQGNSPEAEACVAEAHVACSSVTTADRVLFGLIEIAEAALALERGQTKRAVAVARSFVRSVASEAVPAGLAPSYSPVGFMLLGEAQVTAGDPSGALETARNLADLGPADVRYLTALASRVEGLARQALGQQGDALDCFARAHEMFMSLEMPFEAARALLDRANVSPVARPEEAVKEAQRSLATFERLGAQHYANHARRLLRSLGISLLNTSRPHLGGVFVSERELEIARFVAEGLTAAEIAKRLFLSPRTIETHLARVYSRLGIASRAALTRIVIEAGLLSL